MPKLNSLEVVHQDTNKDSYQTLHDILVELNKSLALNKEVVDGEARASIENLLEMYVNDKEAFLRSLQTLTTQFKNSEAKYEEEILLLASQLEAQAKRTTTLTAQTENNLASVREYSEAVASEVERKTTTYTQDTAPTGNLTYGDLWIDTNDNNRTYSWNGLVWVDITREPTYRQASAPTTAVEGELWMDTDDNNKMYRWDGSSWVATDDLRIATTYSRWGVQTTAIGGGKTAVAGIQLNADNTGTSEFTVLADNFRVYKSNVTSDPIFTTGTVNGSNQVVVNGNLVVTGSIVANSVTVPAKFSFGSAAGTGSTFTGSFVLPAAAYVSVLVTATLPNDNSIFVDNAGTGWVTGAANASVNYPLSVTTNFILALDGSTIFNEAPNNSFGSIASFSASKQVTSAGTKTFSLQVLPYGRADFVNAGLIPRNIEVYVLASMR